MITGKTLIAWGYAPGPWFAAAIPAAEKARLAGADEQAIRAVVEGFAPPPAPPSVGLRRVGNASDPSLLISTRPPLRSRRRHRTLSRSFWLPSRQKTFLAPVRRHHGTNTMRPTTFPAFRSLSAALASGSFRLVTLIGLSVPF
jgi:hypothetical protein